MLHERVESTVHAASVHITYSLCFPEGRQNISTGSKTSNATALGKNLMHRHRAAARFWE